MEVLLKGDRVAMLLGHTVALVSRAFLIVVGHETQCTPGHVDIYSVAGPLFGDRAQLIIGVGSLPLVVSAALLFVRGDSLVLCMVLLLGGAA